MQSTQHPTKSAAEKERKKLPPINRCLENPSDQQQARSSRKRISKFDHTYILIDFVQKIIKSTTISLIEAFFRISYYSLN